MSRVQQQTFVLNKFSRFLQYTVITIWLVAVGVALAVVYGPYSAIKENPHKWTKGENVVYGSLKWILWSVPVAWVIFACHYGYAGWFSWISDWQFRN